MCSFMLSQTFVAHSDKWSTYNKQRNQIMPPVATYKRIKTMENFKTIIQKVVTITKKVVI